jgi:hypothetical protein
MVVQGYVTHERLLQFLIAGEAVCFEHICNAPIESFHHAIGLRLARWAQSVFDGHRFARLIKAVTPSWYIVLTGEAIDELTAVVCQRLVNIYRRYMLEAYQIFHATFLVLICVNTHEHPECCAIK